MTEDQARSGRDAFTAYQEVRKFGALDGLRCFSIAAVVWHHYQKLPLREYFPGARFGFLGVDLFFVISGFLIVTLLLRERDRTGQVHLGDFYARRSFRIFPLYYGVLGMMAIKAVIKGPSSSQSEAYFEDLPYLLLYLENWVESNGTYALAWSLAAEEQFYLIWPPIERFLKQRAVSIALGLVLVGQIISFGLIDVLLERAFGWNSRQPEMLRETTFTPILLGVLLAHALHHRESFVRIHRLFASRYAAPALMFALFLLINALPGDVSGWPRFVVHVFMLALLASTVVREDHGLSWLLSRALIARIGALSYGIYLLHHMGMNLGMKTAGKLGVNSILLQLLAGALCVYALAELSYRFYESRFLRLRAKYRP